MSEVNEVTAQLIRDREYWQLKFEQAVRNGTTIQEQRDSLMAQNDELSDRIHLDLDPRIKRLDEERNELLAANDGLEDTISELRGAIKAYHEQLIRNEWNQKKLREIGLLARSSL